MCFQSPSLGLRLRSLSAWPITEEGKVVPMVTAVLTFMCVRTVLRSVVRRISHIGGNLCPHQVDKEPSVAKKIVSFCPIPPGGGGPGLLLLCPCWITNYFTSGLGLCHHQAQQSTCKWSVQRQRSPSAGAYSFESG